MYFSTGWILLIVSLTKGSCAGLISWNMNLFCGTGYSTNLTDYAGEVYFDVDNFNGRVDKCNLTITPDIWNDNGGNMVMFYFTTFDFRSSCDLINVSVIDGIRGSSDIVQGLPRFICGLNSSLTGQVFSTSSGSLRLQVNVNLKKNWKLYRGQFRLKFITYHTGRCYDSFSHQCSNGHCIPYLYNCSDSINACGDGSDNCNTEDSTEEISGFGNILKYFLILVACICIIWLLQAIGKEAKQSCRNARSVEDSCRNIRLKCGNCCKTINLSRLPKPRLPKFIRNRLRTSVQETADNRSTTDSVDNAGFSDDESQFDQVQVVEAECRNATDFTQTDIAPPSYEEAVISSTRSFLYMQPEETANLYEEAYIQPEEPAPLYEEVVSESPMSSAYQVSHYSTNSPALSTDFNSNVYLDEASTNTERQNIPSDVVLEPDTTSVLNLYLQDFAVELSDNYSTDSDWDSQSDSSVLPADQISVTQSGQNENNTLFISSYDAQTMSSSEWDSESNSSVLLQDQTTVPEGINNTQNASDTDSHWDSESNSSVLSQDQIAVPVVINNTQTVLDTEWDSDSDSSNLSQEQISVSQSAHSEGDTRCILSACDIQNMINSNDSQNTENVLSENVSHNTQSGSGVMDAPIGYTTQTMLSSSDTEAIAIGFDDQQDMPVSPPSYDEAFPPPNYYDYIANVGRYKQNSFESSEA